MCLGGFGFLGATLLLGRTMTTSSGETGLGGEKKIKNLTQTCGSLRDCFEVLPMSIRGFIADYLVCISLLLLASEMMFGFTQTFTPVHIFPF